MEHDKKNELIHRPATGLAGQERSTSPVIARMTGNVLARVEARGLGQARFRIGDYLLREPDYRQIQQWAEALDMAPKLGKTVGKTGWENGVGPRQSIDFVRLIPEKLPVFGLGMPFSG